MRRGLRSRLLFTHLMIALAAIVAVAVIAGATGVRRVHVYLEREQAARSAQVVDSLRSTYREPEGWDATAVYALSQVATFNHLDVAVYDTGGHLLFTVQGRHGGEEEREGEAAGAEAATGGGAGTSPASPAPRGDEALAVDSAPIVVAGRTVGTAQVYRRSDVSDAAGDAYRAALTRDLLLAVAVCGAAAALVSLFLSRRLARPVEELDDAVADVVAADRGTQGTARGDEVKSLVAAFDGLAGRLAREEQRRRDMADDLLDGLDGPLAEVGSRLEALGDGSVTPTTEHLRMLGEEIDRLIALLAMLRDLNDLEGGRASGARQAVDLAEVAAAAVEQRRPDFVAQGVALVEELAPAVALGDPGRLLRVAGALLDSALESVQGGGRVVIAVGPAERGAARGVPDGPAVGLSVTDDGPTIAAADLPFVFERHDAATGARRAGPRLALCRALVEAQGGSMVASQASGGGLRLTVLLPAPEGG